MVENEESLLRLVWHSADFDKDGNLKGAAFSPGDLIPKTDKDGCPKYVSMDLRRSISKASVDWNVSRSGKGSGSGRDKRVNPRFALFNTGELRSAVDTEGSLMFVVREFPVAADEIDVGSPENLAHVGVCSNTPAPVDEHAVELKVNELRTALLELCREILDYETVFGPVE